MKNTLTASVHTSGLAGPPITYFDRYEPATPSCKPTVVMLHGGGATGACWQMTMDGRPGWAPRFAARGYRVLLPDWPGHGRSGALPADTITGEVVTDGIAAVIRSIEGPIILITHSMGGALGWRVAEKCADRIVAIVGLAPGPPGNVQPEGRIVDERAGEILVDDGIRRAWVQRGGITIPGAEIVAVKMVGNSRLFPRHRLDFYTRSLTPLASRLHSERLNVANSQVRIADPSCFTGKPILVLTGSEDIDHTREIDGRIVSWLNEAGAAAEHLWLDDHGVRGNGHMLMLETNSDTIADLALDWLDAHLGAGGMEAPADFACTHAAASLPQSAITACNSKAFDSAEFRRVLGHYPTGVCIVTANDGTDPIAMVVGSFTSVSLDPPLVAFLPDKNSASWLRLQRAGRFCINILASDQHTLSRQISGGGARKLDGLALRPSQNGSPIVDGIVAWIDCTLHATYDAGDHWIAVSEVTALEAKNPKGPLLFYRGGYGEVLRNPDSAAI